MPKAKVYRMGGRGKRDAETMNTIFGPSPSATSGRQAVKSA